jgi:predicted peptidase
MTFFQGGNTSNLLKRCYFLLRRFSNQQNFYLTTMKQVGLLFLVSSIFSPCFAQDYSSFQKKVYSLGRDTLAYRILYPQNYDTTKQYPLIVFLHGAGNRGKDNQKQLVNGGSLFLKDATRKQFPAIVIFPQCTLNDFWARTRIVNTITDSTPFKFEYLVDVPMNKGLNMVSLLLDSLAAIKTVNNTQIYVGGLSMGGMGTFELLWRKPGFFAAAFPIAGGGNPSKVAIYGKGFPIWIFHGDTDPVVDVNDSRTMVDALRAADANVKYTEYKGVRHESWNKAFAEPQLLPWLFSQKRNHLGN